MTKEDFFAKLDWEGGHWGAYQYGLSAENVDDKTVVDLWGRIYSKFEEVEPLIIELEKLNPL